MSTETRTTFTPGPWTVERIYDTGYEVRMPPTEDFGSPGVEIISPNVRADANLIAAAPEMYEALRRYVEISYECHAALKHGAPKDCCGFAQNISDARAALAKAEGK